MTIGNFDRRSMLLLLGSSVVFAVLKFGIYADRSTKVVAPSESVPLAESRLALRRRAAATVPGKEAVLKKAQAELAARETGVLKADTAAQAQAQLMDIIHRIGAANGFDARGAETLGSEARPLGADYGEVTVTENFTCEIEQLVNFLASLANEPEILATKDVHITGTNDKKKQIQVRLSLSGVVPRKLVPVRKGLSTL